jgi:hypothetical protein
MSLDASMDDMMRMSFDELRGCLQPAHTGTYQTAVPGIHSRPTHRAPVIVRARTQQPLPLASPDRPQELDVYLHGPRAEDFVAIGVSCVEAQSAEAMCEGRRDFLWFEELAPAVRQRKRLVFVAPRGGRCRSAQIQAYYARSLGRWLSEEKTDGAGRPYGELRDEDPTLRKKFTKAQAAAILSFGGF